MSALGEMCRVVATSPPGRQRLLCDGVLPAQSCPCRCSRSVRHLQIHVPLRQDGWQVNLKWVRRLHRLDARQLRHRVRRRKHVSLRRGIPSATSRAHERWSMDFLHDVLLNGWPFRVLTVVDQWSLWSLIREVAPSMSSRTVGEALN